MSKHERQAAPESDNDKSKSWLRRAGREALEIGVILGIGWAILAAI